MDETSSSLRLSGGSQTDFRYHLIHDDVVTFDWDRVQNLKGKADREFEGVSGALREKSIEESSAAAQTMFRLRESKSRDQDEVNRFGQVEIGFGPRALRERGTGDLSDVAVQLQRCDDRFAREGRKKNDVLCFVPLRHFQNALANLF